jgi:hypothetical protein
MNTPIVLLIFCRPSSTEKVFEAVRQAKPSKLLVVADGPRADKPGEAEKCQAARSVIEQVDWDCEVLTNYSDVNLGLKQRVSTGLDWAFSLVEEAIILEDDCLPHPTFFSYCEELLEKYRENEQVMMVGGSNLLLKWHPDVQSYYFSYFNSCWGWATWRRAWNCYDIEMKRWEDPETRAKIRELLANEKHYQACEKMFDRVYREEINSWALRWFFARLANAGLSITPSVNLITNIGFTKEATHHKSKRDPRAFLPITPLFFPLKHPRVVERDLKFENVRFAKTWGRRKTIWEVLRYAKRFILKPFQFK